MNKVIRAIAVLVCSWSILTGCTTEPEAEVSNRLAILPNHAQTLSFFGDTLFGPAEASEAARSGDPRDRL